MVINEPITAKEVEEREKAWGKKHDLAWQKIVAEVAEPILDKILEIIKKKSENK